MQNITKIYFYTSGSKHLGSNRIYINDFSDYLKKVNCFTEIIDEASINKIPEGSICLVSKYATINEFKKLKKKNLVIGCIQPGLNYEKIILSDFLIVGSIIENDVHEFTNKPIFYFPLIEKYKVVKNKKLKNNKIILGYHGNLEHLNELDDRFLEAIKDLNDLYTFEFHVIYDKNLGSWKRKPKCDIKEIQWTKPNMINFLSYVDIGICPGLRENNFFFKSRLLKTIFSKDTRRNNDLILQFKYSTNSGRSFLFHQHLIPVVADFSPTNFHILGNKKNGFLVNSKYGWFNSIKKLIEDKNLRSSMAENAFKEFNKQYSASEIIEDFIEFINDLFKKNI